MEFDALTRRLAHRMEFDALTRRFKKQGVSKNKTAARFALFYTAHYFVIAMFHVARYFAIELNSMVRWFDGMIHA